MKDYSVSGKSTTACVTVDTMGIIVDAAPIFKTFEGQHIDRLIKWLWKKDGSPPVVTELSDT